MLINIPRFFKHFASNTVCKLWFTNMVSSTCHVPYMLILSRRIPVIKSACLQCLHQERNLVSADKQAFSTYFSIHGTNVSEFCLQFMLIDLFCSWYYSISIYVLYRLQNCVLLCIFWLVMALDVPVNEAPCCMLLSLFTIVYTNVIVSGVPYNISTLFKYPMCFYISHYELITVLLSIMHTK